MHKIALLIACFFLSVGSLSADYDPVLEAEEAAKFKAAKDERARKDAEIKAMRNEAEMKAYRGWLGAEAQGKSDAEVRALYKQKIEQNQKNAMGAAAQAMAQHKELSKEMQKNGAKWQEDGNKAAIEMTGKSIKELSQMSDAELEAMERAMTEKYGNK